MEIDKVIVEPVITEKTNRLMEQTPKKYVFKVDKRANKHEVMKALHELFSVRPVQCNIVNVKGKPRTVRSRSGYRVGNTGDWKKAIVTLAEGEKIDIFEGA
jgi:large subunit ribosomal protein L23